MWKKVISGLVFLLIIMIAGSYNVVKADTKTICDKITNVHAYKQCLIQQREGMVDAIQYLKDNNSKTSKEKYNKCFRENTDKEGITNYKEMSRCLNKKAKSTDSSTTEVSLSNISRATGQLEDLSIFASYHVRVHNNTDKFMRFVTVNIMVYKGEKQTGSSNLIVMDLPPKSWKNSGFEFYKSNSVEFDSYRYYYKIKY